jgi:hypothetical protein
MSPSTFCIGALGSIARYVSTASWGENNWAVMAYGLDGPVCIAAQSTRTGAETYLRPDAYLIDLASYRA